MITEFEDMSKWLCVVVTAAACVLCAGQAQATVIFDLADAVGGGGRPFSPVPPIHGTGFAGSQTI